MGKLYDAIDGEQVAFIAAQPLFFVATAPLAADGHVNLSPKGLDTFRVLDPTRVAYLDLTGSGNETAAHLAENGRVTFMFCAFDGRPKILRLYCQGRSVGPGDGEWTDLRSRFGDLPGIRQIVVGHVRHVQTSCGFGVPRLTAQGQRDDLPAWAERKGEDGIAAYQREKNAVSIDGLPTGIPTRDR